MEFPYVQICAIISDDMINDGAVKPLITKEVQERDVIDPGGLKEAAAFEGIRLLCFLYFYHSKLSGLMVGMDDLERFPEKSSIRESDRHPRKICSDIKTDRQVGGVVKRLKYFLIVHSVILSGRHPFPKGGYTT